MAYRSPLGYNFKLEASISAAKELQAKEALKNNDSEADSSNCKKSFQFEGRHSGNKYPNSPGWQKQNWNSPRHSVHDESVNIAQYYHPSMVEDPWKEFEDEGSQSRENESS